MLARSTSGNLIVLAWFTVSFAAAPGWAQNVAPEQQTEFKKETDFDLIHESRTVFKNELKPLQVRMSKQSAHHQRLHYLETQFVNKLESANEHSLERVRTEMQELVDRLEMLERLENVLTDMDPDAIEIAIVDGEKKQAELQQIRSDSAKPMQYELSQLQQEYSHKNKPLTKLLSPFFESVGTGEFKALKRKYESANFAYAIYNCTYDTEDKKSTFTVSLQFHPQIKLTNKAYEKLDDRYTIYQWTDSNLVLLVNGIQVTAYDSRNKMTKQQIMDAVKQLVNLEKLAAIE